jgi:hypothetical protein
VDLARVIDQHHSTVYEAPPAGSTLAVMARGRRLGYPENRGAR